MIKRALLTIAAILVAGGALIIYGTYKAADDFVAKNEPQLRQYAQMDEAAQNQYISEHADEIISQAAAEAAPKEKSEASFLTKIKDDPAVQKATADLGRAIMAAAVLHSDALAQELNASLKEKFRQEKNELTNRLERYTEVLEAAEAKLNAAQ